MAGAYVSLADQPIAIYYNPAGLCCIQQKVIEFFPRRLNNPLSLSFLSYIHPLGSYNVGISFMEIKNEQKLYLSIARRFSILSGGVTIGRGVVVGGLMNVSIKEIPGNISIGFSFNNIEETPWIQLGTHYEFGSFNFMLEVIKRGKGPFVPIAGGFFRLENFKISKWELGGGWGIDGPSVFTALDFEDIKFNLSYYNAQVGVSFLFRIGSKRGFEERIAKMFKEREKKEKETARTYIMQGISFYNQGDYENSMKSFDIALIWDPENKDALTWLERVKGEKKKKDIEEYLRKAEEAMRKRDFAEAMRYAEEVLSIDSTNVTALKIYEDAEREFYEYIFASTGGKTEKVYNYFKKGLDYYSKKRYKEAKEEWEKVRKIDPENKDAKRLIEKANRAIAQKIAKGLQKLEQYERAGEYEKALRLAKKLKRLAPYNKKISQKIELYEKKIAEYVGELEDKGISYYREGLYAKARRVFSDILYLDPDNRIAKRYLPLVEQKLKREDADEIYMAGIEAYLRGDYKKAIELWEEVLKIDPSYKKAEANIKRAKEKLKHLD